MSLSDGYTRESIRAEIGKSEYQQMEDNSQPDFLKLARQAQQQARVFATASVRNKWQRSYRAFHNQHFDGSKYTKSSYRGRTKLFKPKTRSAIRKNEAAAAQALFSTMDTVSIQPSREDPKSSVSAYVMHEIINYRFDRSSGKNGIPWFMNCMGARQDSQITGMCFSKQYWEYEEEPDPNAYEPEVSNDPVHSGRSQYSMDSSINPPPNEDGLEDYPAWGNRKDMPVEPVAEEADGYIDAEFEEDRPARVKYDRPVVWLVPGENVTLDPAAPWFDPVQQGGYIRVMYPMHLHEVRGMMKNRSGRMGGGAWQPYPDSIISTSTIDWNAKSVRQARESGRDRMSEEAANAGDLKIIWVYENFFRWEGIDYHFWSLAESYYLTDPTPVEEVYPHNMGERPYVGGYGVIESHSVWPMSPAESWQPLQQESNDITNLRLDTIKQNVSPMAKAKRGAQVDIRQLRTRGPDSTLLVHNMEDVEFDRPSDIGSSAYAEMNHLNSDFDDLAGNFSAGSVMTNRSLNETVGGMKMLSGSANMMTEYDLRIWSETWVEPVIRQVIRLEQYYEDNPEILAIAGERARIYERFGITQISNAMLEADVLTSVDVGMGANDPTMQMQKLNTAFETMGGLAEYFDRPVKVNAEEAAEAIFGYAGFKDGKKFLVMGEPGQPMPGQDEGAGEAAKAQAQAQATMQKAQIDAQTKAQQVQADTQVKMAQIASNENIARQGNITELEKIKQKGRIDMFLRAFDTDLGMIQAHEQAAIDRTLPQTVTPANAA